MELVNFFRSGKNWFSQVNSQTLSDQLPCKVTGNFMNTEIKCTEQPLWIFFLHSLSSTNAANVCYFINFTKKYPYIWSRNVQLGSYLGCSRKKCLMEKHVKNWCHIVKKTSWCHAQESSYNSWCKTTFPCTWKFLSGMKEMMCFTSSSWSLSGESARGNSRWFLNAGTFSFFNTRPREFSWPDNRAKLSNTLGLKQKQTFSVTMIQVFGKMV